MRKERGGGSVATTDPIELPMTRPRPPVDVAWSQTGIQSSCEHWTICSTVTCWHGMDPCKSPASDIPSPDMHHEAPTPCRPGRVLQGITQLQRTGPQSAMCGTPNAPARTRWWCAKSQAYHGLSSMILQSNAGFQIRPARFIATDRTLLGPANVTCSYFAPIGLRDCRSSAASWTLCSQQTPHCRQRVLLGFHDVHHHCPAHDASCIYSDHTAFGTSDVPAFMRELQQHIGISL